MAILFPPSPTTQKAMLADPAGHEQTHVHNVYAQIATHFSATRHTPWPRIAEFLSQQKAGTLGVDIGCGNGKYLLALPPNVTMIGLDRSLPLLSIARTQGHIGSLKPQEMIYADALTPALRPGLFDFGICIATLHHLSTHARRLDALAQMFRLLAINATCLVYVWALEQSSETSRRVVPVENGQASQDVFVPWVMKAQHHNGPEEMHQRYYHLFKQGELESLVQEAADTIPMQFVLVNTGFDRDNWYVTVCRKS